MELSDTSSLRFFAQYFDSDRNGAAMKGIDDYLAPDPRELNTRYNVQTRVKFKGFCYYL